LIPGHVRGTVLIIGFVFKTLIDPNTGEEYTDYFMTNCIDINGDVPKFL